MVFKSNCFLSSDLKYFFKNSFRKKAINLKLKALQIKIKN